MSAAVFEQEVASPPQETPEILSTAGHDDGDNKNVLQKKATVTIQVAADSEHGDELVPVDESYIATIVANFATLKELSHLNQVDAVIAAEDFDSQRTKLAEALAKHIATDRLTQLQALAKVAEASLTRIQDLIKAAEHTGKDGQDSEVEKKYGNRFDELTELFDKCDQGFDILNEHADRYLPPMQRCSLDARIMRGMAQGFEFLVEMTREGSFEQRQDPIELQTESVNNRFHIRLLDAIYSDVHCGYLKAYLGVGV